LLPPLNDTNFSEQYKNFHSYNQNQTGGSVIGLPMIGSKGFVDSNVQREIQDLAKKHSKNKQNMKRSYFRPAFAEEAFPMAPSQNTYVSSLHPSVQHAKLMAS